MKEVVNYKNTNAYVDICYFLKKYLTADTIIVCIGTDKFIGDCLGPLVGTFLEEKKFPLPIYGTIEYPIHALNLKDRMEEIYKLHPDSNIIGIDACLGDDSSIGDIHVRNTPIYPGKGVGKILPEVGKSSIVGIVGSLDDCVPFTSKRIRLHFIMEMAQIISSSILYSYNLINI